MKRILIISLIAFLILLFLGFIYVNSVYIPRNLKPMVVNLLEKNLGKNVAIGKAVYFPLKGVVFSSLSIVNRDQTPYLEIEKVDFSLKSFPRIQKGEISTKIRLVVQGIYFKQQNLQVNGGSILDMAVEIKDKNKIAFSGTIRLDDLQIKGLKPIADIEKINGTIICTENSFSSKDIAAIIGKQVLRVVFSGEYDPEIIVLKNLDATYIDTNFSVTGKLSNFNRPEVDVSVNGLLSLKDIAGIIPEVVLPDLSGECMLTAKGKGSLADLNSLAAQATAKLKQGAVDKIKFSDLNAELALNQGKIKLAPLSCSFYQGEINALAEAKITNSDIPIQCSLDAQAIDIGSLLRDIIGQDMGSGILNAHAAVSGSAVDPNMITGSGWIKVIEGQLRMPPNFKKVANSLGVQQLGDMDIKEASATFSISDGKLETQDMIMVADEATIIGKGYVDLEQYVDFEALFKLSQEFVQNSGGVGGLLNFVSDESGAPLAKIKVYDRISQLKYKIIPLPVGDIIKSKVKNDFQDAIKGIFSPDAESTESGENDLKQQLKEGLRKLFK